MRENRTSGLMSGMWRRSMAVILGHSQTKERANRELKPQPTPPRHISTLPARDPGELAHDPVGRRNATRFPPRRRRRGQEAVRFEMRAAVFEEMGRPMVLAQLPGSPAPGTSTANVSPPSRSTPHVPAARTACSRIGLAVLGSSRGAGSPTKRRSKPGRRTGRRESGRPARSSRRCASPIGQCGR